MKKLGWIIIFMGSKVLAELAIGIKGGYFTPLDKIVDSVYGRGASFSIEGEWHISSSFLAIISIDYKRLNYQDEKFKIEIWDLAKLEVKEDFLRIIPIKLSLVSCFLKNKKIFPYIGGGLGLYLITQKLEIDDTFSPFENWTVTDKRDKFPTLTVTKTKPYQVENVSTLGFHCLSGIKVFLSSNIFFDISTEFSRAYILKWNKIDVGGFNINGKIGYKF